MPSARHQSNGTTDNSSDHAVESADLRTQVQKDKLLEYMPLIIFLGIIAVIGILGNIITIRFYAIVSKRTSTVNLIILLAVLDLIVCFLVFTTMADLCVNIMFTNAFLCKLMYFCDHFIVVSSVLVLWLISVDRYRKVCKPFGKQLSVKASMIAASVMVLTSLVMSVRDFVTYDVVHVNLTVSEQQTVTGYYCTSTDNPDLQAYVVAFHVVDAIMIISVLITFVYTYGFIWREIRKMDKKNLTGRPNDSTPISSRNPSFESIIEHQVSNDKKGVKRVQTVPMMTTSPRMQQLTLSVSSPNFLPANGSNSQPVLAGGNNNVSYNTQQGTNANIKQTKTTEAKQVKAFRKKTENNITIMMLAVSIGFAVCFTPYFFVSVGIRIFLPTGEFELQSGVQFALRTPFLNSVINPIIFCIFNPQYRAYIRKTFCRSDGMAFDQSSASKPPNA